MTAKERMGAFMTGKPVDRVPCVPLILNHAARVIGATIKAHATDGERMGRAHVAAWRKYGQDLITLFSDTGIVGEAMGSELHYPDDDVPRMKRAVVEKPEDVKKIRTVDVRKDGRLPVYLDAIRHCVKEVGSDVMVSCCYSSPFSTAAAVRGTSMLARDLIRNPALADEILEKSTRVGEAFAEAVAQAGGIPVLVDPVATGSILSRPAYERYAQPGNVRVLAKIRELGFPAILHICGRTSHIIDLMAQSGANVLSIDEIDLTEAKDKVGTKVCIMGNIRPTEVLLGGTPETVRKAAAQCLADCGDSPGGYILASGCEVPIETPAENLLALMETARTQGRRGN